MTQCGYLQIVTHFGQSSASHALSGHLIYYKFIKLHSQVFHILHHILHSLVLGRMCGIVMAHILDHIQQGILDHRTSKRIKGDTLINKIHVDW